MVDVLSKNIAVSAMADTGCQSCLAGMKLMHRLGMTKKDLIPVNMRMHAANNKSIQILGAIILKLHGSSKDGNVRAAHQITYITNDSDKLFLCREAWE